MLIRNILVVLIVGLMSACSVPAPKYAPSFDNVNLLKQGRAKPVEVTDFTGKTEGLGDINLRGNPMTSPYGQDFIHYLLTALESEFTKAGLLKKGSSKKLTAIIEENDINTGMDVADGTIKATFIVSDRSRTLYKKSVSATEQWESSFIGAVAIPAAAESYPKIVRTLFNTLYNDKMFIAALKK